MRPTTLRSQALGAALMAAICSGALAQESAAIDPDLSDLLAPVDDEEAADDEWADLIADDEPKDVDASELAALSLEDLMGLDFQVTSVSRKSESLQATAAAVHVITSEDLRRSGVRSIPDALRMAPGVRVTKLSAGRYSVTVRGFTWAYADKVLVLVDGRSVYSPLFSGTEWDTLDLPIDEVERIEIIRGPGGAMWGSNAVNGVINIITKSARTDQDESLTVVYGDEERSDVVLRGGTRLGEQGFLRGFLRSNERDASAPNRSDLQDGLKQKQLGLRADFLLADGAELMLSASAYDVANQWGQNVPLTTPPFQQNIPVDREVQGGSLLARWTKTHDSGSVSTLQGSFAAIDADSNYGIQERFQTNLFFQHESQLTENQTIVWGIAYRNTDADFEDNTYFTWTESRHDTQLSGFFQDQIKLSKKATLTLGIKLEDNPFTGLELQPSLRAAYEASERTTWWGAISRAIQTPSEVFQNARIFSSFIPDQGSGFDTSVFLVPSETDTAESVLAFEAGMRTKLGTRGSLDVSAFINEYRDSLAAQLGAPFPTGPSSLEIPLTFEGLADFTAMGVEIASTYALSKNVAAKGSYSFIHIDERYDDDFVGNRWNFDSGTPKHLAHLGLSVDLDSAWELDTNLYFVGSQNNPDDPIDAAVRADFRLGWRPTDGVTVTLAGQGLLHDDEQELSGRVGVSPYGAQAGGYLALRFNL